MRRRGAWLAILLIACILPAYVPPAYVLAAPLPAPSRPSFADWAAIVVAGDWQGHEGGPTEAFDNARRDVARSLVAAGFNPANLRQFSVRPERYRDTRPALAEVEGVEAGLSLTAAQARGGCLFYLTSHGTPQGAVLGEDMLPPAALDRMLDAACARRPTVVVISACFSGVFVPVLASPERMVLTAARPDRASFGCGEADRYPYFDACFLQVMPGAVSFASVGQAVQTCVAAREKAERAKPPSQPQLSIGPQLRPLLPLLTFDRAPPAIPRAGP